MRLALPLAVLCAATAGGLAGPPAGGLELLILHNNDMHARFEQTSRLSGVCSAAERDAGKCYGGFARVAHLVKVARKQWQDGTGPSVLYLNAGDTYSGTAWFTIYKWKIALDFVNALQPDAVSLGNHEFDLGIGELIPFINKLKCPVLAANLILAKTPELAEEHNLLKSKVFNISGVPVGIVGYLTPDTKITSSKNDVEYVEEVTALRKEVQNLKKSGVNILIALGHSGWTKDLEIAREVEDIDIVIGGHSNTFLWNGSKPDAEEITGPYPTLVRQPSGRMVAAVQAYAYTKYLGKLHLMFDAGGEMISFEGSRPILLDNSVPRDTEILKMLGKYEANLTTITREAIGKTSVALSGGLPCRLRECNLGNMIADAFIYQYSENITKPNTRRKTNEPISILEGGGIRTSVDKSTETEPITIGHLMAVLPFGNMIVSVKMNGSVLRQALERAVEQYDPGEPRGEFLQLSGILVTYDLALAPGHRVVKALARCRSCGDRLKDIEDRLEYLVLMPDFLAYGGNNYTMFEGSDIIQLPFDDLTCLVEYVRAHSPVSASLGRIELINEAGVSEGVSVQPQSCVAIVLMLLATYFSIPLNYEIRKSI